MRVIDDQPIDDEIRYEVTERVATITLHRPDRMNAATISMFKQFVAALDEVDADDGVRAVIVTGAGSAFCAGADISGGGSAFEATEEAADAAEDAPRPAGERIPRDSGGWLALRIFECRKPVIAAINGPAAGVGVTMTLPMDVRIASEQARFGFVFARRGILPEAASSWFLPRAATPGEHRGDRQRLHGPGRVDRRDDRDARRTGTRRLRAVAGFADTVRVTAGHAHLHRCAFGRPQAICTGGVRMPSYGANAGGSTRPVMYPPWLPASTIRLMPLT
jgi:hypothetical protein